MTQLLHEREKERERERGDVGGDHCSLNSFAFIFMMIEELLSDKQSQIKLTLIDRTFGSPSLFLDESNRRRLRSSGQMSVFRQEHHSKCFSLFFPMHWQVVRRHTTMINNNWADGVYHVTPFCFVLLFFFKLTWRKNANEIRPIRFIITNAVLRCINKGNVNVSWVFVWSSWKSMLDWHLAKSLRELMWCMEGLSPRAQMISDSESFINEL